METELGSLEALGLGAEAVSSRAGVKAGVGTASVEVSGGKREVATVRGMFWEPLGAGSVV